MTLDDAWHEAIQMLRTLKRDVERSREERQGEGRVREVRTVTDEAEATDTVSTTDRATTSLWSGDWGTSHWEH